MAEDHLTEAELAARVERLQEEKTLLREEVLRSEERERELEDERHEQEIREKKLASERKLAREELQRAQAKIAQLEKMEDLDPEKEARRLASKLTADKEAQIAKLEEELRRHIENEKNLEAKVEHINEAQQEQKKEKKEIEKAQKAAKHSLEREEYEHEARLVEAAQREVKIYKIKCHTKPIHRNANTPIITLPVGTAAG